MSRPGLHLPRSSDSLSYCFRHPIEPILKIKQNINARINEYFNNRSTNVKHLNKIPFQTLSTIVIISQCLYSGAPVL